MSELEEQLLKVWKRHPSRRDRRANAYAALGLTEVRATQIVNRLLSNPDAWRYDPVTVARLRRIRDSRMRAA